MLTRHYVFQAGHGWEETDILKSSCDPLGYDLMGRFPGDLFFIKYYLSSFGAVNTGDRVEYGGFPRAVGSDKTRYFSLVDSQIEIVYSSQATENLGQFPGFS